MLHSIQFAPFLEAARQRQYQAVQHALATPAAATAVLLGNPPELAVDAVLLLPNALVVLLLTPSAGQLHLPASGTEAWLLDGQPVAPQAGSPNPLAQYLTQLPAVRRWVAEQLGCAESELPLSLGLAVFDAPLTFELAVEKRLHQLATDDFELLGGPASLPGRLRALPATNYLTEDELTDWALYLQQPTPPAAPAEAEATPADYLLGKLRQLWQWLGAADVPPDPPYGSPAYPPAPNDQQEQARLQAFRQELQAELRQQRHEAAAREAAYQQELLRLQQQVLQAGSVASAQQAQAAEAARQAVQAELAARTQEVNQRIQQLSQLIEKLRAAPPAPAAPLAAAARPGQPAAAPVRPLATAAAARPAARRAGPAKPWWQQLPPAERRGLLAAVLVSIGLAGWMLTHRPAATLARSPQLAAARPSALPDERPAENETPARVYVVDSSLAATPAAPAPDTLAATPAEEGAAEPVLRVRKPRLQVDTQGVTPTPTPAPLDSAE